MNQSEHIIDTQRDSSLVTVVHVVYALHALMTGMTQEAYVQMMLDGGPSPDGNRSAKEKK